MIPSESSHSSTGDGMFQPSKARSLPPTALYEQNPNWAQGPLPVGRVFVEAVFDTIPDAMLVLRTDFTVCNANRLFYEMWHPGHH
ncbi:hypothetical protein GC175_19085 [bacterium]|nr:hypothetical protein [bacterium]